MRASPASTVRTSYARLAVCVARSRRRRADDTIGRADDASATNAVAARCHTNTLKLRPRAGLGARDARTKIAAATCHELVVGGEVLGPAAASSALTCASRRPRPRGDSAAVRGRKRPFTIQGCLFDPPVTGVYHAASPLGSSTSLHFMIGIEELRRRSCRSPQAITPHRQSSALLHRS